MKAKIKGVKGTTFSVDGVEFKAGETVDITVEQLHRLGPDAVELVEDEKKGGKE